MRHSVWLPEVIAGWAAPLQIRWKMEVSRGPRHDRAIVLHARAALGGWRVYPLPGSERRGSVPDPGKGSRVGTAGAEQPPAAGACLWAAGGAGSRLGGAAPGAGAASRAVGPPARGSRRGAFGPTPGTPMGSDIVSAGRHW